MNFKDLLTALINPPEGGNPDTIYSDLGQAYDDESAGWVENTTSLETQVADLARENGELKAVNATLMLLVGQSTEESEESEDPEDPEDPEDTEDSDDEVSSDPYDSLFDDEDKD